MASTKTKDIKCKICKKPSSTYRKINDEELCQSCYDKCQSINAMGREKDMLSVPTDNNFWINIDKLLEMKLTKFEEKLNKNMNT